MKKCSYLPCAFRQGERHILATIFCANFVQSFLTNTMSVIAYWRIIWERISWLSLSNLDAFFNNKDELHLGLLLEYPPSPFSTVTMQNKSLQHWSVMQWTLLKVVCVFCPFLPKKLGNLVVI